MDNPLLRAWVNDYYERGWPVVPLPPRRKSKPPDGLTGKQGVDLTREQLLERLSDDANIGIRVPDNVVGIDVDAYDEKVGETSLNWLEYGPPGDEGSALGPLPPTFKLTSRGWGVSGISFYQVQPGWDWIDPGPDIQVIRHTWRYAVAAPSVHPDGRTYEWFTPDGVRCGVPRVQDLPMLPEKWADALRKTPGTSSSTAGSARRVSEDEVKRILSGFLPGPACSCVEPVAKEALDAATRKGPVGSAHDDLLAPVWKLIRAGVGGQCRGAGEALNAAWRAYVQLDPDAHPGDILAMVAGDLAKVGDYERWVCTQEAVEVLSAWEVAEEKTPPESEGEENPYQYVHWDKEFWNPPPPVYLIPEMLIEGQVSTIYSAGGLGKSLLAQDIVVGLTLRGRVFGREVPPVPVLYIDRENSRRGLMGRLRAMGYADIDIPLLHYSMLGAWPALNEPAGARELYREFHRTGARFLVLDTLSKVIEGDENSNDVWNGLHMHTMVGLKSMGVTVLQLDHTGKDTERGQRGGSSKQNNADVIWHLSATDNYVRLDNKKDRDDDYEKVLYLERHQTPLLEHRFTEVLPAAAAEQMSKDARIDELVAAMDDLKLEANAGRTKVKQAFKESSVPYATEELIEAIRRRKAR